VLLDAPRALLRRPLIRRLLASRFSRWVIKPGIPAVIGLLAADGVLRWPLAAFVFVVLALVLNSRAGRNAQEVAADGLVRSGRHLTSRIVPGASVDLEIFAELMGCSIALYRVDSGCGSRPVGLPQSRWSSRAHGNMWSVAYFCSSHQPVSSAG
jgi:hypothetical protein